MYAIAKAVGWADQSVAWGPAPVKFHVDPLVLDTFAWVFGVKAFLDALETAMPDAAQRERDALRRVAESEGWDEVDYFGSLQGLDAKFELWIPNLAAYSAIILLHSLVETQLLALARRLKDHNGYVLGVADLAGSPIDRAKKYLTKVAGLRVGQYPQWEELKNLQKLRNIIVHSRGTPSDSSDEQQEMGRLVGCYKPDLSVERDLNVGEGEVHVSLSLCRHFIAQIEEFFKRLFRAAELPDKGIDVMTG